MPSLHSLLSPSSAHRWMVCHPSALAESKSPDEPSPAAQEGTAAHAVCEQLLRAYLAASSGGYAAMQARGKELQELGAPADMVECAEGYVDYTETCMQALGAPPVAVSVEEQVELMPQIAPDLFGTCDLVLLGGGTLHVIDYKFGRGVKVDAANNPQLMMYALGAAMKYQLVDSIERVRLSVYQPRMRNTSEWGLTYTELLRWAEETLYPAAKRAYIGEGERVAGEHCRFCKVKPTCRALATHAALSVLGVHDNPADTLNEEDIARVLSHAATVRGFLDSVEKYALDSAVRGTVYKGFKVVEGRSVRKITDPAGLQNALQAAGYSPELTMRTELKTLTALESVVGRDKLAALGADYINKPAGAPQLVPESDKRPAYNYIETTKQLFQNN